MNRRRKTPKVQWVIVYHGTGCSLVTHDARPCWNTRKAALTAIVRLVDSANYEVVKFVRA